MTDSQYEAGVMAGKLSALETQQKNHETRLDRLERTLRTQEKVTWGLLGAIALIQLAPALKVLMPG